MPIKRSQSAPIGNGQLLTKVIEAPNVHLPRSKSYLVQHSAPLNDREDPFSLAGFFPGSSEERWKWLRRDEGSERASVSSFSVGEEDSALGDMDDELAREAIQDEDKLGVLSLNRMFLSSEHGTDDRLFSPYFEGEAVDHESLYLSLCARRKASSEIQDTKVTETWGTTVDWPTSIFQGMRQVF